MMDSQLAPYKAHVQKMKSALKTDGISDRKAMSMLNAVLGARDFEALMLPVEEFKQRAETHLQSQQTSSGNIAQRSNKLEELHVKETDMEDLIDKGQQ